MRSRLSPGELRLPTIRSALCSRQKCLIFVLASSWEWPLWRNCGENIDGRASGVDWYERNKYDMKRWNLESRGLRWTRKLVYAHCYSCRSVKIR